MTGAATPLPHPHLHQLSQALAEVETSVERLIDGLTDGQLRWTPEPGRWSIAQCLDHVTCVNRDYRRRIAEALDGDGVQSAGTDPRPFRPRIAMRPFLRLMGPRSRWRLPAPRRWRPAAISKPGTVTRFFDELELLMRLVTAASAYDLNRNRLTSPLSRLLRLSLGEALTLLTLHCERHVQQAWRVREHPDFPYEIA